MPMSTFIFFLDQESFSIYLLQQVTAIIYLLLLFLLIQPSFISPFLILSIEATYQASPHNFISAVISIIHFHKLFYLQFTNKFYYCFAPNKSSFKFLAFIIRQLLNHVKLAFNLDFNCIFRNIAYTHLLYLLVSIRYHHTFCDNSLFFDFPHPFLIISFTLWTWLVLAKPNWILLFAIISWNFHLLMIVLL